MQPHEMLEAEFAKCLGLDPECCVACSSGTAALHLALESLQLPTGSEIVCPDFTMIACPRAISLAGHKPVFVDCLDNLDMSCEQTAYALSKYRDEPPPAAVMAVHIYGRESEIPDFMQAAGYDTPVIEDLAECHGLAPHPNSAAAAWSMYKNKVIAGEEGGMVFLRDSSRAALARSLRCQGFTDAHDFTHIPRGHNYRLAPSLANLILDSLYKFEVNLDKRRAIEAFYDKHCPAEWKMPPRECPWVYDLRIRNCHIGSLIGALREAGIEARHSFKPCSFQEEYMGCQQIGDSRKAVRAAVEVLYLPIQPDMTTVTSILHAFDILRTMAI